MADDPVKKPLATGDARFFLSRAVGFWTGPERRTAWFWTGAALLLLLANLAVNVGINRWNKWFFDALEAKEGTYNDCRARRRRRCLGMVR